MRPERLEDVIGQEHLVAAGQIIHEIIARKQPTSLILWGPPGTGKTSIARLLADAVGLRFVALSAVFSGVADLKKVFAEAKVAAKAGKRTLLFVDEIHRFNRSQQDGFLPFVEDGTITLVGATTENPSFELNAALLSRCQVLILHRLDSDALCKLLQRAARDLRSEGHEIAEGIPLGAMIEVPAAAVALPTFIGAIDFLSIGTNDLVQYLLAADRNNEALGELYTPLHPALLRLLYTVIRTARARGKSACGAAAISAKSSQTGFWRTPAPHRGDHREACG